MGFFSFVCNWLSHYLWSLEDLSQPVTNINYSSTKEPLLIKVTKSEKDTSAKAMTITNSENETSANKAEKGENDTSAKAMTVTNNENVTLVNKVENICQLLMKSHELQFCHEKLIYI